MQTSLDCTHVWVRSIPCKGRCRRCSRAGGGQRIVANVQLPTSGMCVGAESPAETSGELTSRGRDRRRVGEADRSPLFGGATWQNGNFLWEKTEPRSVYHGGALLGTSLPNPSRQAPKLFSGSTAVDSFIPPPVQCVILG